MSLAEHLKASDEIVKHVEQSDALAKSLGEQLKRVRETLEELRAFAPDERFTIRAPYHLRQTDNPSSGDELSMKQIIERQVRRINTLLGDRVNT